MTTRLAWIASNNKLDSCEDIKEGQLYKVFCDLHCLEDAVLNGNHAILKSLHSLRDDLLQQLNKYMFDYTQRIFNKVKETQNLINHNDRELNNIMTDYTQQIMKQATDYTQQIMKQAFKEHSKLNTAIA